MGERFAGAFAHVRGQRVFAEELAYPFVAVDLDRVDAGGAQHDGAVIGGVYQHQLFAFEP